MRESFIEIDLTRLNHNWQVFKNSIQAQGQILANLKANAYGLGAIEIGRFLESKGAAYFSVAYINEGIRLRKAGIQTNLLVFNPSIEEFKPLITYRLEPEVSSIYYLKKLINYLQQQHIENFPIHLKLDTGMHRAGITSTEIPQLINLLKTQKAVYLKSVFSHLAAAEDPSEDNFTKQQIHLFDQLSKTIKQQIKNHFFRHLLNTAGVFRFQKAQYEMIRPGLGIFGYNLIKNSQTKLLPVAQLKSKIVQAKKISIGESVGYNRKFTATSSSYIGLIPLGYADGIDRRLSQIGFKVKCRGYKLPIVGNISMDTMSVDLSHTPCKPGDEVTVIDHNTDVYEIAQKLNTIPYEIIAGFARRLPKKTT